MAQGTMPTTGGSAEAFARLFGAASGGPMPRLLHVPPGEFLVDTFRLGQAVYRTGFRPKHAISIWRGGTPVGLGVDAFFRSRGHFVNHTTIATGSYTGFERGHTVTVKNLEHLVQVVCPEDPLLIVDDVYESGRTIQRVVEQLREKARANAPERIMVAAIHEKPALREYGELPVVALHALDNDVWVDYPHELADLVDPADPEDGRIRSKDPELWEILRGPTPEPREVEAAPFHYVGARELLLDCVRLGLMVARDATFRPDYLIALWPGGVLSGLPVHEVYKYVLAKGQMEGRPPDHISVNTSPTRLSYRHDVIGLQYLEDRINHGDNILVIDTTFRAGRLVNDVIMRLKASLRRNLNHKRIRVASVYWNPDDTATWTVRPDVKRPDYFLKVVRSEVIYPHSVHKLPDPREDLRVRDPALHEVLYG